MYLFRFACTMLPMPELSFWRYVKVDSLESVLMHLSIKEEGYILSNAISGSF